MTSLTHHPGLTNEAYHELMRFARKVGHEWADAELRRRGVVG